MNLKQRATPISMKMKTQKKIFAYLIFKSNLTVFIWCEKQNKILHLYGTKSRRFTKLNPLMVKRGSHHPTIHITPRTSTAGSKLLNFVDRGYYDYLFGTRSSNRPHCLPAHLRWPLLFLGSWDGEWRRLHLFHRGQEDQDLLQHTWSTIATPWITVELAMQSADFRVEETMKFFINKNTMKTHLV